MTVDPDKRYPPTRNQSLLWLEQQQAPRSPLYNMPFAFWIEGPIDEARFREAFERMVAENEALRTVFLEKGGEVFQEVRSSVRHPLAILDLRSSEAPVAAANRWMAERCRRPFELTAGLIDSALLRTGERAYVWYFNQHHLITDAWSTRLLYGTMVSLYERADSPTRPGGYAALLAEERSYRMSAACAEDEQYWRKVLGNGWSPPSYLGRPVPAGPSAFVRTRVAIGGELSDHLRGLAVDEEIGGITAEVGSLNILVALLGVLLHKISGAPLIGIGVPVRNRTSPAALRTLGLAMEIMPMHLDMAKAKTFTDVVRAVASAAMGGLRHYRSTTGNPRHTPHYDSLLNLHVWGYPPFAGAPVRVEWLHSGESTGAMNLQVHDFDRSGEIAVELDLNAETFPSGARERTVGYFRRVLEQCLVDHRRRIDEIDIVSDTERRIQLDDWSGPPRSSSSRATVVGLFASAAVRSPGRVCIRQGGGSWTYADLDRWAGDVATRLARHGITKGSRVAICLDRSPALIAAELSVLSLGAAFVPIDPSTPSGRIRHILNDAGCTVVLADDGPTTPVPAGPWTLLSARHAEWPRGGEAPSLVRTLSEPAGDDPAYVVYTSGTTGVPKGVEVPHRALANLVLWFHGFFGVTEQDRFSMVVSPGFDPSLLDVWPALCSGAAIAIPDNDTRLNPALLARWIAEEGITLAGVITPMGEALLDESWSHSTVLRSLFMGGEQLRRRPPPGFPFRVVNLYGPSETTVLATASVVEPGGSGLPDIGRPIENVTAYVCDGNLRLLPIGMTGELCIGGLGVALGYVQRPDLTAERFPVDPFRSGEGRLYRTGDLVRWSDHGALEFFGRGDTQVKIRGYRIELAEIESVLLRGQGVREAVVRVWETEGGGRSLAAYLVPEKGQSVDEGLVRSEAAASLPEYMVPTSFVFLDRLPMTAGGKVDRKALPPPPIRRDDDRLGKSDAVGETERGLQALLSEILGRPDLPVDRSFFDYGGDSLLAMRVLARITTRYGVQVRVDEFFRDPSIRALALLVDQRSAPAGPGPGTGAKPEELSDEEVDRRLRELMQDKGAAE